MEPSEGPCLSGLNAALIPSEKAKFKIMTQRIKLFLSNLTASQNKLKNIYKDTKISRTQQGKIHKVWCSVKCYQVWKEESMTQDEEKTQLIDTNPEMIE